MTRIAVWNTAFLGDAVLTLPLLQSLRLSRPGARIDFYVRKGLECLFTAHPGIDAVFPVDKKDNSVAGFLRLKRELVSRSYDIWISAHASLRSGLVAATSRAPLRIGYASPLYNRMCYSHIVDRRFNELEEVERLLQLLQPLDNIRLSTWPELALCEDDLHKADVFFKTIGGPVLGLHPGSVWPTKRWPAAYFADIGRRAIEAGAQAFLFAGPGEEAIAKEVCDAIRSGLSPEKRKNLHDLSGRLSLPRLAAYLGSLSCYLTNDSGPMHIAWALRTPVTAIFGPTVKKLGFFPRGSRSTVFEIDIACRPCGLHGPKKCPKGHHHCMTQLLPDTVWPDVQGKLFAQKE